MNTNPTPKPVPYTLADYLNVLSETAFKLVDLPDEDSIYTYLGQTLHHLLGQQAIIIISRTTPDETEFSIQGTYGVDAAQQQAVTNLLGYWPREKAFSSDPAIIPLLRRGELIHFDGGLLHLSQRFVSPVIARQLIHTLNLGEVYLIGLVKDARFYAAIQIYMQADRRIEMPTLIETLVKQASTAIQRVQALQSLATTKIRYESLFQQSNDAVFILDMNGRHLRANQRAADMMGYTPDEIMGLSYRDMVVPDEHDGSASVLQRMLRGERVLPYERTFRHKDGHRIPTEINVEIVRDDSGEPSYIQSVVRDITERKLIQQHELELRLEQERREAITSFIENTTHEFYTPLSVINVQAELMARLEDPDLRRQKADEVAGQVKRLTRLVSSLLLINKLQNKTTLATHPVNLKHMLEAVCQKIAAPCERSHTMHCDIEPDLPLILGDEAYLRDALLQIMDNACRFTPAGGIIKVSARLVDTRAWIEIANSGPGISTEAIPHIFDTFWRQDPNPNPPGFGLGLPIARKIIELHSGDIIVESSEDHGTTMRIRLPLMAEQVP